MEFVCLYVLQSEQSPNLCSRVCGGHGSVCDCKGDGNQDAGVEVAGLGAGFRVSFFFFFKVLGLAQ